MLRPSRTVAEAVPEDRDVDVTAARPARVAVVCDYPEECWPSMDLTGEMILSHLASGHSTEVTASRFCPPFRHRAARFSRQRAPGPGPQRRPAH